MESSIDLLEPNGSITVNYYNNGLILDIRSQSNLRRIFYYFRMAYLNYDWVFITVAILNYFNIIDSDYNQVYSSVDEILKDLKKITTKIESFTNYDIETILEEYMLKKI